MVQHGHVVAAAVGVAAQLTGLKGLDLRGVPKLADVSLLPLTALTALQELEMWAQPTFATVANGHLFLRTKVRFWVL